MMRNGDSRWLSGVAAGVAYLHDHGIVHRDLKPGNLFDDEGTVKIGDYGLSKFISVSRRSGQTESVGTLHYMAPEIGRGSYGREIDIYAMGIMLHEMLTGDVPFNGESSQEIIMKHLTADPEIGDVSEPYRAVILKALAKDPEHRFRTVAEMLEPLGLSSTSTYESPSQAGFVSSDRSTPSSPDDETVYIGDEPAEEMVFDELHQRPGAEVVDAELVTTGPPDEPIAASVREGALRLRDWWNNAPIGTPLKVVVIVGVIAAVLINATWLIPVGVSLTLVYGIYWAIRAMALGHHTSPSTATLPPKVGTPGHQQRPRGPRTRRRSWYKRARADMAAKSPQQWTTELVGSLLTSAAASAVIAVVMMLIAGANVQSQFQSWAPQYLWLTIVSTLGCWAVLIPAKCWESHPGEQLLRRFGMLIFGLVLGAVACGVASLLMWNMNFDNSAALGRNFSTQLYGASGVASPKAFLASFAGLLVALRWWRQADPLRPTRISVWATASAAGAAVLLYYVCPFPHPWGVMVATTISVAVQVSAPWMTSKERSTLRRQLQGS